MLNLEAISIVEQIKKLSYDINESTDYDFAANVHVFAAKFSRLLFNEFASNFLTNSRLFCKSVLNLKS